jgi:hypothetical protein
LININMKNLETIADELFHKIRGRFPKITVGNEAAEVVNKPKEARFFEFDFANGKKVSVSIDQKALTVMYGQNLFSEDEHVLKSKWFDFLKELRVFAKKRMLNFDTRDITKTNLDKRDYEYLSTEKQMSESKMYGTSRTSYQDVGTARLVVKHAGPVNHENAAGRTQNVHSIYIESDAGERFKYPFRHLNGARAMAMHVSEGGNAYDDFGKHITGLSEELNKLRKFKTYMNRSSVMAEGLSGYMDVVNERLVAVKKTVESLQRKAYYTETFTNFETTVLEEVPEDVSNTWIDELTIRQFNEELKGVFPYVYNLVKEANKIEEVDLSSLSLDDYLKRFEVGDTVLPKEESPGQAPGKVVKVQDDKCMVKFADGSTEVFTHDELEATDAKNLPDVDEGMGGEYHCKDCGDTPHNPTTNCSHDVHDENGDHWVDNNGNGIHDADEGIIDPQTAYAEKLDSIISQAKHEQSPAGESQTQMTAEDQQLREFLPVLSLLAPAAGAALRFIAPKVLPSMMTGAKEILKYSVKNPIKATVGATAAANPTATKDLAVGAVNTVKGGAELVGKASDAIDDAGEVMSQAKDAISSVGGKVSQTADDLKSMAAGALDKIPDLSKVADIAKQYAIPGAIVVAILLGGKKLYDIIFGDKEEPKEPINGEAKVISITPDDGDDGDDGGKGDELKQKNEIPLDEFIKGMYDYTSNAFPKGETAVLTAVQKQYGDEMVDEAQEVMTSLLRLKDAEMARIQTLAGLR